MPDPIRTTVVDKVVSLLGAIDRNTSGSEYNFTVPASRIFAKEISMAKAPTPALAVIQRVERPFPASIGFHKRRVLLVNVGFVFAYGGQDPDGEASKMIADIQRAIGENHVLSVTDGNDDSTTSIHLLCREIGSAMNVAEPIRNRVYGQVDYELEYHTRRLDPRKI